MHEYVVVDVFAETPFQGNPVAILPAASELSSDLMLCVAREFRLPETVFVTPGHSKNMAKVRIFTPAGEAPFAGHPLIGAGAVLAERYGVDHLALEAPAGSCDVRIGRDASGHARATLAAPQPLQIEAAVDPVVVARALNIPVREVITTTHLPTACGHGRTYVVAEVTDSALATVTPNTARFAAARQMTGLERFSVLAYVRHGSAVQARMFSPLTGNDEDPATGSANLALVALLHQHQGAAELSLTVTQGVQMGRPSILHLRAWRGQDQSMADVTGTVVPVMAGSLRLS